MNSFMQKDMKTNITKILLALLILLAPLSAIAHNEKVDTLLKVEDLSNLVITESPEGSVVTITSVRDSDVKTTVAVPYSSDASVSSRQSTFRRNFKKILLGDCGYESDNKNDNGPDFVIDGVCIGLTKAVANPSPDFLQWSKSFEISWLNCFGVAFGIGKTRVSIGLGFDWRNYKTTYAKYCIVPAPGNGIDVGRLIEDEDGVRIKNSRLKVFSLQVPVLFRARIPSTSLYFKAGPIMNFNTYASLKTVYEDYEGNQYEMFTKELNPNRFTVDFFGSLSLCRAVGVYVRYSPMKVMKSSSPLNFKPLTIGVCFGI